MISTRDCIILVLLVIVAVNLSEIVLAQQENIEIRSQILSIIDSWTDRASAREALIELKQDILPILATIAIDEEEIWSRRLRSISLLGTFHKSEAVDALEEIAISDKQAQYRCLAIQALAELSSRESIPVLIKKLDDSSICMKMNTTDPAREFNVYVSDEAVRALEIITGQSFDKKDLLIDHHKATKPWKCWWKNQQKQSTRSNVN